MSDNISAFAPFRLVASYADGARLTFDGVTEADAMRRLEAAQETHGEITWYDGVTDENYDHGKYFRLIPPPPTIPIIDLTQE